MFGPLWWPCGIVDPCHQASLVHARHLVQLSLPHCMTVTPVPGPRTDYIDDDTPAFACQAAPCAASSVGPKSKPSASRRRSEMLPDSTSKITTKIALAKTGR